MVAVDSSALIAIFKNERSGAAWLDLLLELRAEDQLAACDVVWSEVAPLFASKEELNAKMAAVGVSFSALDEASAYEAGRLFAGYRQPGGVRSRMIPDFMIAAHALGHGARLATADDNFMNAHFSKLKTIRP